MRVARAAVGIVVVAWLLLILAAVALLLIGLILVGAGVQVWAARGQTRRLARAGLLKRCDEQHAWVMRGDDRGIYGEVGHVRDGG